MIYFLPPGLPLLIPNQIEHPEVFRLLRPYLSWSLTNIGINNTAVHFLQLGLISSSSSLALTTHLNNPFVTIYWQTWDKIHEKNDKGNNAFKWMNFPLWEKASSHMSVAN